MLRALALFVVTLAAAPAATAHPGALPGEGFTFKFSLGPIEGGRARMAVGAPVWRNGRRIVAVHGQAETTALVKLLARETDDYQLIVDDATLLPLAVDEHETGVHNRVLAQVIDGRVADTDFNSSERKLKARRVLPKPVRDPLTGFFALRALPLVDKQHIALDILDGLWLFHVDITVVAGEMLTLTSPGARPQRTIRLDAVAHKIDDAGRPLPQPPRKLTLWLGDDAVRPLLKLQAETELGPVMLELTSYVPARAQPRTTPQLPGIEVR